MFCHRCLIPALVAATLLVGLALAMPVPARAQADPANQSAVDRVQTPRGKQIANSVERHIAELHKRLKITPAQEQQWAAFAEVMRDNAIRSDQLYKSRADAENMNALDDLRSYAGIAQAHADDVQRLVPVFEALYTTLTPDQQRAADQAFKDFEQRGKHPAGRG